MSALHYTSISATVGAAEQLSLAALFRRTCLLHPTRAAVTAGDQNVTYSELETAADRVAAGLLERGVRPGCIVAIYLERSVEMITSMLGVIKAGAVYLPLDTTYPVQRIIETLADASPSAVIGSVNSHLAGLPSTTLYLRVEDLLATQRPCIDMSVTGSDAAYVIYTSGSTGKPKGVVVSHHNVVRLISQTQHLFNFNEDDVWTMFHSFAFDFSVWEIWGCLLTGGRLVVVPFTISRSPDDFLALLVEERVTVLNQTPSAFALLSAQEERTPGARLALRYVIFGGEALAPGLLRGWFSHHDENSPQMINMYGITETTVHVTYRRMLASDALTEQDSLLGEPIGDLQLHLLDDQMRPVPAGAEGELYIGGAGVSLGYLNRPQLTAERFLPDPRGQRRSLLYRSGDIARWRPDGELVYLGRRDGQVKINGFRVETSEIEAALLAYPGVRQVCVSTFVETPGDPARLVAYLVAESTILPPQMRTFLASRLPAQMLPAFYEQLPAFPLTANGKIDRGALPVPRATQTGTPAQDDAASAHSATEMEQLIARTWRRILHTNHIPLDQNFFDLGGTSVLVIAVRAALEDQLDRKIPVAAFFEHSTVRGLARALTLTEKRPAQDDSMNDNARKQRAAFARARANRSIA